MENPLSLKSSRKVPNGSSMSMRALLALPFALTAACGGIEGVETTPEERPLVSGSVGAFLFDRLTEDGVTHQTVLTGAFDASISPCTQTMNGVCVREDCPAEEEMVPEHAGLLTASSGDLKLSVLPGEEGVYPAHFEAMALWEPGGLVKIEAEGGSVAPFTAELPGPAPAVVAKPRFRLGRPIDLSWFAQGSGEMYALFSYRAGHARGSISCRFPAEEGKGRIPAALLEDLDPQAVRRLSMGLAHSRILDVEGSQIEVMTYRQSTTTLGEPASFPLEP
jgi:hypothetical protein